MQPHWRAVPRVPFWLVVVVSPLTTQPLAEALG